MSIPEIISRLANPILPVAEPSMKQEEAYTWEEHPVTFYRWVKWMEPGSKFFPRSRWLIVVPVQSSAASFFTGKRWLTDPLWCSCRQQNSIGKNQFQIAGLSDGCGIKLYLLDGSGSLQEISLANADRLKILNLKFIDSKFPIPASSPTLLTGIAFMYSDPQQVKSVYEKLLVT